MVTCTIRELIGSETEPKRLLLGENVAVITGNKKLVHLLQAQRLYLCRSQQKGIIYVSGFMSLRKEREKSIFRRPTPHTQN